MFQLSPLSVKGEPLTLTRLQRVRGQVANTATRQKASHQRQLTKIVFFINCALPKIAVSARFWCLVGPLVAKFFHILVEEVISFKMSGVTSKLDKY